jgi:hypothetical protein
MCAQMALGIFMLKDMFLDLHTIMKTHGICQ